MLSITINDLAIDKYLAKYEVQISEQYDTKNSFKSVDGKEQNVFLGYSRELSVDFEPMATSQINKLFQAILSNAGQPISISYVDPKDGQTTRSFKCPSLPAATYFESDYTYDREAGSGSQQFWTLPTINFVEDVSTWDSG